MFFSFGLAFFLFGERPGILKICGSLISFIGIGIVAAHVSGGTTFIGLVLTLLAAISWASGNMFTKKVNAQSPLALVVWGNLVAFPFMLLVSLVMEGPQLIANSLVNVSWASAAAVFYIVYLSTHFGYGAWGFLLKTYTTSLVVPFTLLVPVVGFLTSALYLGEDLPSWKILASLFIMGGLMFNLFEKQISRLWHFAQAKT